LINEDRIAVGGDVASDADDSEITLGKILGLGRKDASDESES
jgi:hypothetical protein